MRNFENLLWMSLCAFFAMQGAAYGWSFAQTFSYIYLFLVCDLRKCKLCSWNTWWCAPRDYFNISIGIRLKIYASISIRCETWTGITTCCCCCQEFILFAFLFFVWEKNYESQWWCSRMCAFDIYEQLECSFFFFGKYVRLTSNKTIFSFDCRSVQQRYRNGSTNLINFHFLHYF